MSALEPRIEAIRKKYDLQADDFWQIKQNKQWVCKHAALEVVATKAGIEWLEPKIIETNAPGLVTSMIVTGKLGDRIEWATGETNPTNYSVTGKQPAYPWAMSEKRAKDRVILKLSGVHGLLYSDAEMDAEPNARQSPTDASGEGFAPPVEDSTAKLVFPVLQDNLRACATRVQLDNAWLRWEPQIAGWSETMHGNCDDTYHQMIGYLNELDGDGRKASRGVIEAELRAAVSMEDLNAKRNKFREGFMKLGKDDQLYLSAVIKEMTTAIAKAGGTMPDFNSLSRVAADPNLTPEEEHAVRVAQTP